MAASMPPRHCDRGCLDSKRSGIALRAALSASVFMIVRERSRHVDDPQAEVSPPPELPRPRRRDRRDEGLAVASAGGTPQRRSPAVPLGRATAKPVETTVASKVERSHMDNRSNDVGHGRVFGAAILPARIRGSDCDESAAVGKMSDQDEPRAKHP
jgi:hypothetical protein